MGSLQEGDKQEKHTKAHNDTTDPQQRSEERRVGKEWRKRLSRHQTNTRQTVKQEELSVTLLEKIFLMAALMHFFFFKQKTAYEIGLGIPAEPLFRSS